MQIISIEYILFSAGIFFAYWLSPQLLRRSIVLIGSLLFYYLVDAKFFGLLLFSITLDYFLAIKISESFTKRKVFLVISIVFNIGLLFVFKFSSLIQELLSGKTIFSFSNIGNQSIIPLGISFYTFHAISYIVDVYKGKVEPAKRWMDYALFISFFPKMIAGPIERADDFFKQINEKKLFKLDNFIKATELLLVGFYLKIVVSEQLKFVISEAFDKKVIHSGLHAWTAVLAFTIQIYADFLGYMYMAIGMAIAFGFHLTKNFDSPYLSSSPSDFWKRWHISLSFWFRDYLYFPLGGGRSGNLLKYRNIFIVFIISGFWHGLGLTFLAWSLFHVILLSIEYLLERTGLFKATSRRFLNILLVPVMFVLINISWIFFRAPDMGHAKFLLSHLDDLSYQAFDVLRLKYLSFFVFPWIVYSLLIKNDFLSKTIGKVYCMPLRWFFLGVLFLQILIFSNSSGAPFLYFKF